VVEGLQRGDRRRGDGSRFLERQGGRLQGHDVHGHGSMFGERAAAVVPKAGVDLGAGLEPG
jgi:hypothetical protein